MWIDQGQGRLKQGRYVAMRGAGQHCSSEGVPRTHLAPGLHFQDQGLSNPLGFVILCVLSSSLHVVPFPLLYGPHTVTIPLVSPIFMPPNCSPKVVSLRQTCVSEQAALSLITNLLFLQTNCMCWSEPHISIPSGYLIPSNLFLASSPSQRVLNH